MKFNEDILKQFNLEQTEKREPVNVMQVEQALDFLKQCANRIVQKSRLYERSGDVEEQMDCLDIVTAKLNDFTQVFKDIIIFMRKAEKLYNNNTSLRYCITSYDTFDFEQTEQEKLFLRELLLRNEITHDYFNREIHHHKLIWVMTNCCDGALDVYENLYGYCKENQLLDKYINL